MFGEPFPGHPPRPGRQFDDSSADTRTAEAAPSLHDSALATQLATLADGLADAIFPGTTTPRNPLSRAVTEFPAGESKTLLQFVSADFVSVV